MSPRPRKASDEQVFAAASRVMSRLGPAQLRLSDIAAEAGLTSGALVQRFGSKRGLLLAHAERVAGGTSDLFAELRARSPSPLAALRDYADCIARMGESPGALAHHLSYLQLDLTDPDLHRYTQAQAYATRNALRELLEAAVIEGELSATDCDALARAVEVTVGGSLIAWAFYRDGTAADWVQHDLDALLRPHLLGSKHDRRVQPKRRARPGPGSL